MRDTDMAETEINRLLAIMARLRDPDHGCPWDRRQSFDTIAPYTIEEAYEVSEAIRERDMAALVDELGDLLFQIVFYAQMGRESGAFDFADITRAIADKMVRRHPHVFGERPVSDPAAVARSWEAMKAEERSRKTETAGVLDGVAAALPALSRAAKLQRRAAQVGFDWPDPRPVIAKLREELDELETELDRGAAGREQCTEEIGDVLFACANLARHVGADPETALRAANAKFEARFRSMETDLSASGRTPAQASASELEVLWEAAKRAERESH